MARYIDADTLYQKLYPLDLVDKKTYAINAKAVADAIDNIPTADVVPRAEVDLYKRQVDELEDELASTYDKLESAKADVAREIFGEIEAFLKDQEAVCENKRLADIGNWIFHDYLPKQLAALKEKYTEGGDQG